VSPLFETENSRGAIICDPSQRLKRMAERHSSSRPRFPNFPAASMATSWTRSCKCLAIKFNGWSFAGSSSDAPDRPAAVQNRLEHDVDREYRCVMDWTSLDNRAMSSRRRGNILPPSLMNPAGMGAEAGSRR
jgi:hypothetical protein